MLLSGYLFNIFDLIGRQAEYDELAVRVGSLTEENNKLREELTRIRGECEKLSSDNAFLSVRGFSL